MKSKPLLLLKSVSVFATLNEAVLVPELPAEPEFVALSVSVLLGQYQSLPASLLDTQEWWNQRKSRRSSHCRCSLECW